MLLEQGGRVDDLTGGGRDHVGAEVVPVQEVQPRVAVPFPPFVSSTSSLVEGEGAHGVVGKGGAGDGIR